MNITIVFFIYGLAFFSMGLAMFFESTRSPLFVEQRVLFPLSIFGFVHGTHEWLEMFLERSGWLVLRDPVLWGWLRVALLTISFASLLIFGLQLLLPRQAFTGPAKIRWFLGLAIYILFVVTLGIALWHAHVDFLLHLDAEARYLLAVPGAGIAGIALQREANRADRQSPSGLAGAVRAAGWGFVIYAFTQIVVPPLDMFPASVINTATFQDTTSIPIQVIRAAVAILVTFGLIRATNATEEERQRRFMAVQQSRLEALQQIEKELKAREAMRIDHLRHIVEAQEEERARIARELHDETSQTLTAFTFHLAALRNILVKNSKAKIQLDHLQNLSRRMSAGIYHLVHDLRPTHLDDLGLVAAVNHLANEVEKQMGLKVEIEIEGERRRLDPLIETALYRIAQEALTNTARHSGVNAALLRLSFQHDQISLSIVDHGVGFLLDKIVGSGWGLAGMQERAASINGKLNIITSPGNGTRVEVLVAPKSTLESPLSGQKESNSYADH